MRTITIILLLFSPGITNAQSFDWTVMSGGPGSDQAYAIATDENGNSYVTGWFSETAHFGDFVLNSEGGKDVFLAKYSNSGAVIWAKKAWGIANNTAAGICLDESGNAYITGWFAEDIHFGEITLESHGSYDMFVAKYNADGEPLWARNAGGGDGDDYGNRICLNFEGDVLIAGSFRYTAHFGEETTITSAGNRDIFIANYSSDGNFHWVKRAGGAGEDRAYGIVSDDDGSIYFTGVFNGKAFFDDMHIVCTSFLGTYIAKMNAGGTFNWVKKGIGGANDYARGFGIDIDGEGYVYNCGYFSGKLTFSENTVEAYGGEYDFDIYLVKYRHDGMIYWLTHAGGYGMDQGLELISDQEGSVYMTGLFSGVAHFGDQHIESQGKADVFVAKYTGTIDPLWIKRAGGNYLDYGYSISKDSQDALYICGNFQEEAAFGNHIIEGVGGMDMFVAKLSQEDESVPEHSMGAIILSPNPNTGNFEIKLPPVAKNKTLVIYDLKGKMVFHQDIKAYSNTVEILTNLTPGTYVLEITGTSFRQKLLIQ